MTAARTQYRLFGEPTIFRTREKAIAAAMAAGLKGFIRETPKPDGTFDVEYLDLRGTCPERLREANHTKALHLRAQAQGLLDQAAAIDGLKPYCVVHEHEFGVSTYLIWHTTQLTQQMAEGLLDSEFEPERGEQLTVHEDFTSAELAGVGSAQVSLAIDTLDPRARN